MGLWAKSIVIFNAIRDHGKQSIRSLADRTGLSKSSVHRHLQAIDRRDRYQESSLWETEPGSALSSLSLAVAGQRQNRCSACFDGTTSVHVERLAGDYT